MGLLAPLFLLGLAGLVVPIVVHLTERQRREVVDFPSLMFLRKIPFRSSRRKKIHHWALLAVRTLALALLVAAFSRPFFENDVRGIGTTLGPREVVVVLDRSYSMGYGDRWERAKTQARQVFEGLDVQDRASLVLMSKGAEALLRATSDQDRLLAGLNETDLSADGTLYGPALKLAQTILEESQQPNREVVIISDFQRSGWNGDEGVAFPTGTLVTPVLISDETTPNASVASLILRRDFFSGQERMTAEARVVRRQGDAPEERTIVLELDGQETQTQTVSLDPTGSAVVTFDPFTLSDVYTLGSIRLDSDALPQDDELHFVLSPGRAVRTLVLEGANPRQDASFYLETAHISEEASFEIEVRRSTSVSDADLASTDVVILNDSCSSSGRGANGGLGSKRYFPDAPAPPWITRGKRFDWAASNVRIPCSSPLLDPGAVTSRGLGSSCRGTWSWVRRDEGSHGSTTGRSRLPNGAWGRGLSSSGPAGWTDSGTIWRFSRYFFRSSTGWCAILPGTGSVYPGSPPVRFSTSLIPRASCLSRTGKASYRPTWIWSR